MWIVILIILFLIFGRSGSVSVTTGTSPNGSTLLPPTTIQNSGGSADIALPPVASPNPIGVTAPWNPAPPTPISTAQPPAPISPTPTNCKPDYGPSLNVIFYGQKTPPCTAPAPAPTPISVATGTRQTSTPENGGTFFVRKVSLQ